MERTEEHDTLAGFEKERGRLRRRMADIESLLSESGSTRITEACRELREKLEESAFNLVVMGQFKRGKSTLINALLGEALLPTAVSPLTSVITMLRYGERTEATAYFLDGTHRRLPVKEVPHYITEKYNPENEKGVDRVEIEFPAPLLRGGVRLIDTPGVGSVFQHNTDIAYRFMPRADAVLFLVTADPPISREELRFLADVREHAARIFFLKNKIDHLTPEELEESIAFSRAALAEQMDLPPERIAIYPISARWALEGRMEGDPDLLERSGLTELECALERFLMTEKGRLILETARRRTNHLLAEATGLLELELRALETPAAELSRKADAFGREQEAIEQEKEDLEHLVRGGIRRIMADHDEATRSYTAEHLPRLEGRLRRLFEEHREEPVPELSSRLEERLREMIEELFTVWRKEREKAVEGAFSRLTGRLAARANQAIDRIYETAGDLFDIGIRRYQREEGLAEERYFSFRVAGEASALDPFEDLLTYGIAAIVSKRILLRKTLAQLPRRFDRQCGRVRADLLDRLRESGFRFTGRIREHIDRAYAEIDQVIDQARRRAADSRREVEERSALLERTIERLRDLSARLEGPDGP